MIKDEKYFQFKLKCLQEYLHLIIYYGSTWPESYPRTTRFVWTFTNAGTGQVSRTIFIKDFQQFFEINLYLQQITYYGNSRSIEAGY